MEKCVECQEEHELDDMTWSHTQDAPLCQSCESADFEHPSTLLVVENYGLKKYYIGKHIRITEYGDDIPSAFEITRDWISTSDWRGYFDTKIKGWSTVTDGWTTGGWDDAVARRKHTFNEWMDEVCSLHEHLPFSVAFLIEPTSNVFSTAITLLAKTDDIEKLKEWMGSDLEKIVEALT